MRHRARRLRGARQRLGAARLDPRDTRGLKRSRTQGGAEFGLAPRGAEGESAQAAITTDVRIAARALIRLAIARAEGRAFFRTPYAPANFSQGEKGVRLLRRASSPHSLPRERALPSPLGRRCRRRR